ncbi:MAG: hypothetical protein LBS72_01520 [Oscillospiraceae bacterium]|jgi:hypothetical protein|nr:hypothetical protein [Oscillospiraceae bacterium]
MYTVLLAADQPGVLNTFRSFTRWSQLGYTEPLVFDDASEAVSALGRANVHAVSIALPPSQSALLYDRLHGMHMLFLEPVSDPESLETVLRRMTQMIERRQENRPTMSVQAALNETFFQTLLDGFMHSEIVLRNRMQMLDLPIRADERCLLFTLRMANGDSYLREVWSYGRARLAMALRKFFQKEENGVYYALSELRAGDTRLLACPTEPMSEAALAARAREHIQTQIERVAEFIELELVILSEEWLDGIKSLLHAKGIK